MELKVLKRSQLREVEEVFASSTDYLRLENGELDIKEASRDFFDTLPPGKTYKDKQTMGIYESTELVGLIDLAENYPIQGTYFLGLLLFLPKVRNQGLGSQAHQEICQQVIESGGDKLRLGVLRNNPAGLRFWQRQGYKVLKATKSLGERANPVYLMELDLLSDKNSEI
ncbi:MAG: GNAT family N-acetyltransferase [Streptococcaceae bacterium]|jgi:ribosomal protein S18 acetylase RimI-like enzyme|nr:GNAT family N-acetyltransferase [Streptococcaceae bacterium]